MSVIFTHESGWEKNARLEVVPRAPDLVKLPNEIGDMHFNPPTPMNAKEAIEFLQGKVGPHQDGLTFLNICSLITSLDKDRERLDAYEFFRSNPSRFTIEDCQTLFKDRERHGIRAALDNLMQHPAISQTNEKGEK